MGAWTIVLVVVVLWVGIFLLVLGLCMAAAAGDKVRIVYDDQPEQLEERR